MFITFLGSLKCAVKYLRYNRQKQAIGDETDDTFVKPQAVDDVPFARDQALVPDPTSRDWISKS